MYEARQNKEKVSRRIEVGGGARQMMKMENRRRTIIQLNRQIAKEYANTAKTIYDTITTGYTPDFAGGNKLALTIAVNDSHFTVLKSRCCVLSENSIAYLVWLVKG